MGIQIRQLTVNAEIAENTEDKSEAGENGGDDEDSCGSQNALSKRQARQEWLELFSQLEADKRER